MILAGWLASALAAAAPAGPVLLVSYQAEGLESGQLDEAMGACAGAWRALGREVIQDEQLSRASRMCGEEPGCLAALGSRAHARWVVAVGLGRVGRRLLTSFALVDVPAAQVRARHAQELEPEAASWPRYAKTVADELWAAVPAEPPPVVVAAPPAPRPRPWPWVAAGTGAALLAAGGTVGLLAQSNYQKLEGTPLSDRAPLASQQRLLNHTADGLLAGGVLLAGAAIFLFLQHPAESVP